MIPVGDRVCDPQRLSGSARTFVVIGVISSDRVAAKSNSLWKCASNPEQTKDQMEEAQQQTLAVYGRCFRNRCDRYGNSDKKVVSKVLSHGLTKLYMSHLEGDRHAGSSWRRQPRPAIFQKLAVYMAIPWKLTQGMKSSIGEDTSLPMSFCCARTISRELHRPQVRAVQIGEKIPDK